MKRPRQTGSTPERKKRSRREEEDRPRVLRLHASFTPPGRKNAADLKDSATFLELLGEARSLRIQKKEDRLRATEEDLRARERHFQKLSDIIEKTIAVHQARKAGAIDGETASRQLREICPDYETQMEVAKFLLPALEEKLSMTEGEWAAKKRNLAAKKQALAEEARELAENLKLIDAREQAHQVLEFLSDRIQAGDERAIADTVSIAEQAITLLLVAEKMHPAATRKVAAWRMHWPILGSREPGWERRAAKRLESLQVGSALEFLHTRFREARGADENYPARQWAKAAVRTVEETLGRWILFDDYWDEFGELVTGGKMVTEKIPEWVTETRLLPAFSAAAASVWGKVIRAMIREQVPQFHDDPDWESQRNTARHTCRDSRGEIQNAILDDIVSALRRIAPLGAVPKSGS